jgi:hypothetical protein
MDDSVAIPPVKLFLPQLGVIENWLFVELIDIL